ncbi:LAFE_0D06216g1_1 [Lachancea fermentati]|uniref:Structural maintenance of chromosomes protein n=1 Tax=Lachancea fermentati TaxID=4955 RepID=A0A1G4MBC4_LACFM|nr:LAFE_0D06216g1_1 [Lachancea fermentati]
MKVEELIIDGFKSYATRTVISHWDPQFNAITGLNGSGKSNILDAICFVLGISSMATVRASNLQDLIYKRGQAGVTKASVTIVFDNLDKSNSPIGFESYPKISVTRQIILGGTSKYLINGHRAQQQTVLHLFQSVQLNINNPNFLIMQGKITKVLNMKPTEILSLIEEAAGTKMFEDRREKAERTMAKKETKLQEIRTLLEEEIEPKLEKLRNEKRAFLEFQETQTDMENTLRIVNTFIYNDLLTRRDSMKETLETGESRLEYLNVNVAKTKAEIKSLEEDLETVRIQKQTEFQKDSKLAVLEREENDLKSEVSRLSTALGINEENVKEEKAKLSKLQQNLNENESTLSGKSITFKRTEAEHNALELEVKKLEEQLRSKEELLSTLTTGISLTGNTDSGYSAQLSAAKTKLNNAEIKIKENNMKIEILRRELLTNEPRIKQAEIEDNQAREEIKNYQESCAKLEKQLVELGFDQELLRELRERESRLKTDIYHVSADLESFRRMLANIEFNYAKPSMEFDPHSVKGVAAQLFTLDEKNFDSATALQVCAGGRLFNVVVDNEKTASQLLERGKLRKRVTIIPLNKISARRLNEQTLRLAKDIAPNGVELALNLIGYEEEVTRAMEFIFGTSLICKDANIAKKVTFHPQVRARSITLQGDVYDPEGTLSGGSRNNKSSLLVDIQKYNLASKRMKIMEDELTSVQNKIRENMEISAKTRTIQNELNLATHKLRLVQKNLDSNPATQIIKRNNEIKEQISRCEEDIMEQKRSIDHYSREISRIQNDIDEFSKDKGSKLEELKSEIGRISETIEVQKKVFEDKYELFQTLQLETDQLESDIQSCRREIDELNSSLVDLKKSKVSIIEDLDTKKQDLEQTQERLSEERQRLIGIDEELRELQKLIKAKASSLANYELEHQKLSHDLHKFKSSTHGIEQSIKNLEDTSEFLKNKGLVSSIIAQNRGINLEEYRQRGEQLKEKFQGMKRKINPNIMSMIENVEKKESALRTMIKTIEKDKTKIQETISKLNEYKRETLIKTWQKVSVDFGQIFADLLPNSFAKLVAVEGKDITEGLEVKIRLGSIWKESLVELSGGQRSLIALSLILALLQFKPAPMYILDEVDAALDLSHTQNIGHLIKTRFKGSQFIIVSLKEGMFANANRVFRTRFQDGTSVVSVM